MPTFLPQSHPPLVGRSVRDNFASAGKVFDSIPTGAANFFNGPVKIQCAVLVQAGFVDGGFLEVI